MVLNLAICKFNPRASKLTKTTKLNPIGLKPIYSRSARQEDSIDTNFNPLWSSFTVFVNFDARGLNFQIAKFGTILTALTKEIDW